MYKHLLVPIDGTPLATTTVDQAVAYAKSLNARLTFLHARADLAARSDGALLHAMAPAAFADAAAGNAHAIVAKAEAAARAAGVPCESVVVITDRPHEAILDVARSADCDLIFMASHGRRGLKGAVLGSVTNKVLQNATLPVLVVAIESNLPTLSDEQRALSVIRDEHRSLAAVLHALLQMVDDTGTPINAPLARAMLFYIENFPERLHHPKEDAYLFRKLSQRTAECDALLAGLQQQHVDGAAHFAPLRQLLDAGSASAFAQAVREFAQLQWQHMSTEERLVLPAAGRHLKAEDWQEIAQAFGTNGDPRFGTDESFAAFASRLLALAATREAAGA